MTNDNELYRNEEIVQRATEDAMNIIIHNRKYHNDIFENSVLFFEKFYDARMAILKHVELLKN